MIPSKPELRKKMKRVLNTIPSTEQRAKCLSESVFSDGCLSTVSVVSTFISLADEVSTKPLIQKCWDLGIRMCIPIFDAESDYSKITCREWVEAEPLVTLDYGVRVPKSGQEFSLGEIDLFFVPGLAFTLDGRRLGRGVGFYDRLLSRFSGTSIGLCYKEQILSELPTEKHDQSVDRVFFC